MTGRDEIDALRRELHDLRNRCCASELLLSCLVDWAGPEASALAWMPELRDLVEDARKILSVEGRAVVDPPGTATTNAAVDGGDVAGGRVSAPPGLPWYPIVIGRPDTELRVLVEEARDLAKHLLDQGECPECHGGECADCKGWGVVVDDDPNAADDDEPCGACKGEGVAPHLDGCRLETFPARAAKALE